MITSQRDTWDLKSILLTSITEIRFQRMEHYGGGVKDGRKEGFHIGYKGNRVRREQRDVRTFVEGKKKEPIKVKHSFETMF